MWAVFFLVTAAATIGMALVYVFSINTSNNEDSFYSGSQTHAGLKVEAYAQHIWTILLAGVLGAGASLVAAFFFMMLSRSCANLVVHAALYFVSVVMVLAGLVLLFSGVNRYSSDQGVANASEEHFYAVLLIVAGSLVTAFGAFYTCCLWCRWSSLIPFTVTVVEAVAHIADDNPCMIAVSMIGSVIGGLWTIAVFVCFVGVDLKHRKDFQDMNKAVFKCFYVALVLVLFWGGGVIYSCCHTIYCGLFGRWYFGHEASSYLMPSIKVTLTKSFGSICLGSFLVALVRTVEVVVRSLMEAARQDDNIVACILLCIVDSFVKCIGDILEYFSEWAYVQVALRGSSFCEAARITYSLMTCANIQYIVADLLIETVVTLGAAFCAAVGALVGAGVGWGGAVQTTDQTMMIGVGALMGLIGGSISGASSMSIFGSGAKTVLVCWAEDWRPLQELAEDLHSDFCSKLYGVHYGPAGDGAI